MSGMNYNTARDQLREEKILLQKSLQSLVEEFEMKTGLLVDKLEIVRNNLGYGDKTILIGIDATVII